MRRLNGWMALSRNGSEANPCGERGINLAIQQPKDGQTAQLLAAGPHRPIELAPNLAIVNALTASRYSRDHLYRRPVVC